MIINTIEIFNFRNIEHTLVPCSPTINIFHGQNGSGKTSLLEAIHYLGLGRSFRTRNLNRIIRHGSDSLVLISQLINNSGEALSIGIEKKKEPGQYTIRIGGTPAHSLLEVTKLIPLQLLNADSHLLIASGPLIRRQFLDWGAFHVEPLFYSQWQRANRLLKQRNVILKTASSYQDVRAWDNELVTASKQIDTFRSNYFSLLEIQFSAIIKTLLPAFEFCLQYYPGWDTQKDLEEILYTTFNRDKQLGYSQYGPQRGDLRLKLGTINASEILSQGEQKLAAYGLRLAQGKALKASTGKRCIFLIDDLPSELDPENRAIVVNILKSLDSQLFLTGIEAHNFADFKSETMAETFHVEHGKVGHLIAPHTGKEASN